MPIGGGSSAPQQSKSSTKTKKKDNPTPFSETPEAEGTVPNEQTAKSKTGSNAPDQESGQTNTSVSGGGKSIVPNESSAKAILAQRRRTRRSQSNLGSSSILG